MDDELRSTLEKLELGHLESEVDTLGVTSKEDILELEKEDLQSIGLTLVQIRKLQNACKGKQPAAAAPATKTKVVGKQPIKKAGKQGGKDCKWCRLGECWTPGCGSAGGGGADFGMEALIRGGGGGGGGGYMNGGGDPLEMYQRRMKKHVHPKTPFKRTFLELMEGEVDTDAAQSAREELLVTIDGGPADGYHAPASTFEELTDIPAYCIEALNKMDIVSPMPIQAQALPIVLGGHDLVGVAKTGSGKTLAYLLPAAAHIEAQEPIACDELSPIVVCLAPTRELAVQIQEEAEKLFSCSADSSTNHPDGIKSCCIYGGMKKDGQLRNALGAHVLAATPGRLYEHVIKDDISMERVTYFVLDEGDRMLEDGFEAQVKVINGAIRPDRHMLFFSATWPMQVHRLAKAMCKGAKPPVRLRVGQNQDGSAKTRDDITQEVIVFDGGDWETRDRAKKKILYERTKEALEIDGTKILVFVGRKDLADEMSYNFNGQGFESQAMHGGKTQDARLAVLESFKTGDTRLLCTTDVMGRGLDIPTITHVFVYDMGDIEDYVHRIGRTARGPNGEGCAMTLFEYDPRWPHLAEGLIKCLEQSNQDVPEELRQVAEDVKSGTREIKSMKGRFGAFSGNQGSFQDIEKKKYGASDLLAKW